MTSSDRSHTANNKTANHTVEKIGGTSMSAFDAVLDNILLRPENPYNRMFVVSAYGGITDALLECKRTGRPGIYRLVAEILMMLGSMESKKLQQRMLLIVKTKTCFADRFSLL